jgi:hypothetical protein
MSDLGVLGVVLVLLALAECALWAPHGAVIVSYGGYFGAARMRVLSRSLGNARGAFTLLNPLPPFGRSYVVEPWPFSVSEEGVTALRSFSLANEPRPPAGDATLLWSEVRSVEVDDRTLRVNGARFATAASRPHARAAAAVLEELRADPTKLDDLIARHLDPAPVRARASRHRDLGVAPMLAASGLFASLFLVAPRMAMTEGLARWSLWLALIYVFIVTTSCTAFRVHRALHPAQAAERWQLALLMLPAPTTALRVNDRLGRHLLAGAHPIAAALALLDGAHRDDVIGRAMRDLASPRALPSSDERALRIEGAFRARVLEAARRHVADAEVHLRAEPGTCPRCRLAYRDARVCADCGIAIVERGQS